jgi:hypothetical protein
LKVSPKSCSTGANVGSTDTAPGAANRLIGVKKSAMRKIAGKRVKNERLDILVTLPRIWYYNPQCRVSDEKDKDF